MELALRGKQLRGGDGAIAVTNGCVATPDGLREPCSVLIRDERIASVGTPEGLGTPSGATELDAAGSLVLPGFIDVRSAVGVQMNSDSDAPREAPGEELVRGGVTRFLVRIALSSGRGVEEALRPAKELWQRPCAARPLGLRVEVPLGGDCDEGVGLTEAKEHLRVVQQHFPGSSVLVIVSAAAGGSLELMEWAACRGMTVGMAVGDADYDCGRRSIEAGARYTVGTLDALDDLHHREPGAIGAGLVDDRVTAELLMDEDEGHAPAVELVVRAKGAKRCVLTAESGMAGAVRRAAAIQGVGVGGASRMASESPAALCGASSHLGGIAEGMAADLVLMTRELDVVATLVQGELAYQRDAA